MLVARLGAEGKAMGHLRGRVGGEVFGNSIACELDGNSITGRFGGRVIGKDLNLQWDRDSGRLTGRYGGVVGGKDIDVLVSDGRLKGRAGGIIDGADLDLEMIGKVRVRGRIGGEVIGFSVDLEVAARVDDAGNGNGKGNGNGNLVGRLGGGLFGHDARLALDDFPVLVAAGLAAAVYFEWRRSRRGSGGSHGGSNSGGD